jgi:hypothetical protein
MALPLVKEPYLEQLRAEVAKLQRLVDSEPNDVVITHAWTSFDKIKENLSQLCPNHPQILAHR